ncbi:hypothetical protein [Streptomyces sp. NBC_00198]|uniref:hypothetical protein n=1 Tax=Streptomyces sp. NBC_00198 TaxID=2975677 RepID=UPI002251BC08|nr:hypothetical protein [Streptomyces sp. NBC_00198]MCX5281356.1 hypothetical protein [Streptomyces sp. NBC_00198]
MGTATLEWWAHRLTCLGAFEVRIAIRITDHSWTCDASLCPLPPAQEREDFASLVEVDPFFALRFDDGSTLDVQVVSADADGGLVITAAR